MKQLNIKPKEACMLGGKHEPYMSEEQMLSGPPEYRVEDLTGGDLEILNNVAWKHTKLGRNELRRRRKQKKIEGGFMLR